MLLDPHCYTIYATKDEYWTLHKPDRLEFAEPLPVIERMEVDGGKKVSYHPKSFLRNVSFEIKGSVKYIVEWFLLKGVTFRRMSMPLEADSILPGIYAAKVKTNDDERPYSYVCIYVPEDGYDGKVPLDKLRYKYHYSVKE